MPSKLNIVVKIPPSQFPDGSYMTIIPDPVNPSLAPLFAGSIGYVSGVSTIESVDVDAGSYLNGYAIDNLATHLNGAVITATTLAISDTNAPTFSLSPNQTSYTISEGDTFSLPVLTLNDDIDGTSTPAPTSNTVDTSTAGNYEVTWSGLSDSAGNVIEDVTVSVVVEAVSSKVLIYLAPTGNSHYTLNTAWTAPNDFEFSINFRKTTLGVMVLAGKQSDNTAYVAAFDNSFRFKIGNVTESQFDFVDADDGRWHTLKYTRIDGALSTFFDRVLMGTSLVSSTFVIDMVGRSGNGFRYNGILSNLELTDLTTASNTLEFKLNKLTDNFEYPVNNVFGSQAFSPSNIVSTGPGWSDNGDGTYSSDGTNSNQVISFSGLLLESNETYEVLYTLSEGSTGNVRIILNATGNNAGGVTRSAGGSYHELMTLDIANTSGDNLIRFQTFGLALTGTISGISVRKVTNAVTYQNIPEDARETYSLTDGFYLGSQRVINGALNNGAPEWEYFGEWTILNDTATRINGSGQDFRQRDILTIGDTYQVSVDVLALESGGSLGMWNSSIITIATTTGKATINFTSSLDRLTLLSSSAITIDNISAKRVIEVA
jgi:hypothetical protein